MWILRRSELPRRALALAFFALVSLLAPTRAAASDTPEKPPDAQDDRVLGARRERFNLGMDHYKGGAVTEAIGYWEPLYLELGAKTGYRLAYDLGVAYAALGDATRAAERLQAFLDEAAIRRAEAETLPPVVLKEEADARARLNQLVATNARVRFPPSSPAISVRVDAQDPRLSGFVAWLSPGRHTVTFAVGTPRAQTVALDARAGELVELTPADAAPANGSSSPETPAARPTPSGAPAPHPRPAVVLAPHGEATRVASKPFSGWVLAASGAATLATGALAVSLELHAASLRSRYAALDASTGAIARSQRNDFDDARTSAYAAVAGALGLGALTGALTAWYAASGGAQSSAPALHDAPSEWPALPEVSVVPRGVRVNVFGRF